MKKFPAITVAGGLIATTGVAFANDWVIEEIINLDDMKFTEHRPFTPANEIFSFDVFLEANNNPVVGFAIAFDYINQNVDSSWASDLELQITTPSGSVWIVGQSSFNGGDPFGPQDDIWDFDGPNSEPDGHYFSDHFPWKDLPEEKGGIWNFMFTETWDGATSYNNVVVSLYKIPAPGGLAILGIAGLVGGTRRRRRA